MTITWRVAFLAIAIVCFVLAAFAVPGPKGGWVAIGLAFFAAFFWPG